MERSRCIDDHNGKPLCGADADGAYLVAEAIDANCTACLTCFAIHRGDRNGIELLRELAGAPSEGWPLITIPADSKRMTLTGDCEVEADPLRQFLEDGGSVVRNGWQLLVRGALELPKGIAWSASGLGDAAEVIS